jgi:thiamine-monophosphate kinase
VLFVTGRLGGSYLSGRHARFLPRLAEAQALVRRVRPHAMIDLSDGLAQDLWQMSRASGVTLRVEAARIPVARAARRCPRRACGCRAWRGRRGVYHALMDGEDFELLFAVSPREAARVPRRIGACPITRLGAAVARGVDVELQTADGRVSQLVPRGFRHF